MSYYCCEWRATILYNHAIGGTSPRFLKNFDCCDIHPNFAEFFQWRKFSSRASVLVKNPATWHLRLRFRWFSCMKCYRPFDTSKRIRPCNLQAVDIVESVHSWWCDLQFVCAGWHENSISLLVIGGKFLRLFGHSFYRSQSFDSHSDKKSLVERVYIIASWELNDKNV